MLVKPFYKDREQTIVGGYQVAMPSKYGEQPWYIAGGSLGHDLSLNRLRDQWDTSPALRQQAQQAWQHAGRNLAPAQASQTHGDVNVLEQQRQTIDAHFQQLRKIPLADGDRWAAEAQHVSGLIASWAKAGGPHADQLQRAARHLGRSASLKHQPQVPTRKQPWMRGAALVLAQAATSGNGAAAQVLLMKHVLETVQALAMVHEATKQHRRAQALRHSLQHDLRAVEDAVLQLSSHAVDVHTVFAGTKQLTAQDLATPAAPMPTAIPETRHTPDHEPGRDGFSR